MLFAISLILLYRLSQPVTEYSKSQNHWGREHRLPNDTGRRELNVNSRIYRTT